MYSSWILLSSLLIFTSPAASNLTFIHPPSFNTENPKSVSIFQLDVPLHVQWTTDLSNYTIYVGQSFNGLSHAISLPIYNKDDGQLEESGFLWNISSANLFGFEDSSFQLFCRAAASDADWTQNFNISSAKAVSEPTISSVGVSSTLVLPRTLEHALAILSSTLTASVNSSSSFTTIGEPSSSVIAVSTTTTTQESHSFSNRSMGFLSSQPTSSKSTLLPSTSSSVPIFHAASFSPTPLSQSSISPQESNPQNKPLVIALGISLSLFIILCIRFLLLIKHYQKRIISTTTNNHNHNNHNNNRAKADANTQEPGVQLHDNVLSLSTQSRTPSFPNTPSFSISETHSPTSTSPCYYRNPMYPNHELPSPFNIPRSLTSRSLYQCESPSSESEIERVEALYPDRVYELPVA